MIQPVNLLGATLSREYALEYMRPAWSQEVAIMHAAILPKLRIEPALRPVYQRSDCRAPDHDVLGKQVSMCEVDRTIARNGLSRVFTYAWLTESMFPPAMKVNRER